MRVPSPARRLALPAVLLGLVVASAGPVTGQTYVSGRVTDAETGAALEGAVVRLVEPDAADDDAAAGAFTDADGRFRLRLERPGRYRLTAERIGYRRHEGDVFLVKLGERAERDVELRPEGVELSGIEVTTRRRCSVDPETAEATQRLWREARRALEGARWTSEHGSVKARTRNFERRLDADFEVVETVSETRGYGIGATPYRSLPAEDLSRRGYADARGDHLDYFAPDAEALLSDHFQQDHCFWVTRDDAPEPGWVGLAFEPAEGRDAPEIEGVLWLDERTAELERLEFGYVNLPFPTSAHSGGGEVDFHRLPSGPWIVRRWSLRMPLIEREDIRIGRYHREDLEVAGYDQEGGQVVRVTDDGRPLFDAEEATVAGTVHDSLRSRPLSGAVVELVGTDRVDTTDVQGDFRFPAVPEGSYRVRARHPLVGDLELHPPEARVEAEPGRVAGVRLGLPGPGTVVEALCPDASPDAGAVVGRVRTEEDERVPEARVASVWPKQPAGAGEPDDWVHRQVRTDDRGLYRLCGVPTDRRAALRAEHRAGVGAVAEIASSDRPLRVRDLELGPGREADRLASLVREQGLGTGDDPSAGAGPGVLRGTVFASGGDEPLSAAEVVLDGERVSVTDSAGRFDVEGVAPGRHRVRVRYVGFASQEALVRVTPGDTLETSFLMETDPVPLPELAVRVESGPASGFEERRRGGAGHYVTREEIEEMPGDHVTDVLREVPGLQVAPCPGRSGDCIRTTRSQQTRLTTRQPVDNTDRRGGEGGGGGAPGEGDGMQRPTPPDRDSVPQGRPCGIAFFVDGAPVDLVARAPGDPTDPDDAVFGLDQIPKEDVESVEVYSGPSQIPAQFKGGPSGCARAAIVIWTRAAVR